MKGSVRSLSVAEAREQLMRLPEMFEQDLEGHQQLGVVSVTSTLALS
jgi:hypothetical protein